MKRAKSVTVNVAAEFWADRWRSWVLSDVVPIGSLLTTLERRSWADDQIICPPTFHPLSPPQVTALKLRLAQRIAAESGGSFATAWGVVRSDGEHISMCLAAPAAQPAATCGGKAPWQS
jgi:hypothetical protein